MHRFIPSADAPANPPPDPAHAAAIKRWTRDILHLADTAGADSDANPDAHDAAGSGDTVITVTELACADAGCPLVETIIAVFEPHRTRRWRFTRPRIAVTKLMLQQTLATPPAEG